MNTANSDPQAKRGREAGAEAETVPTYIQHNHENAGREAILW